MAKLGWIQKLVARAVREILSAELEKLGGKIGEIEKTQATIIYRLERIEADLNKLDARLYEADKQAAKLEGAVTAFRLLAEKSSRGE